MFKRKGQIFSSNPSIVANQCWKKGHLWLFIQPPAETKKGKTKDMVALANTLKKGKGREGVGSTGRMLLKNTNFETKIMFSLCYANVDFLIKTKSSPKQGIHYVNIEN